MHVMTNFSCFFLEIATNLNTFPLNCFTTGNDIDKIVIKIEYNIPHKHKKTMTTSESFYMVPREWNHLNTKGSPSTTQALHINALLDSQNYNKVSIDYATIV
jgi:hypothetical protein